MQNARSNANLVIKEADKKMAALKKAMSDKRTQINGPNNADIKKLAGVVPCDNMGSF